MDDHSNSSYSPAGRLILQSNPSDVTNPLPIPPIANDQATDGLAVTAPAASSAAVPQPASTLTAPFSPSPHHSGIIEEAPSSTMNLQSQPPAAANSNNSSPEDNNISYSTPSGSLPSNYPELTSVQPLDVVFDGDLITLPPSLHDFFSGASQNQPENFSPPPNIPSTPSNAPQLPRVVPMESPFEGDAFLLPPSV